MVSVSSLANAFAFFFYDIQYLPVLNHDLNGAVARILYGRYRVRYLLGFVVGHYFLRCRQISLMPFQKIINAAR